MFGKLFGLISVGGALSGINLTKKFIANFILILALTTIGAIVAGALVVFGLYESYELLLRHGLDADMAALVAGSFGLMILLLIVTSIAYKAKQLQATPLTLSQIDNVKSSVVGAVRGFYRGVSEKSAS